MKSIEIDTIHVQCVHDVHCTLFFYLQNDIHVHVHCTIDAHTHNAVHVRKEGNINFVGG